MKQFYTICSNEKVSTLLTQLSWSHYLLLISLKDIKKIKYYINISESNNLTFRQLEERIKNHEYERLPQDTKDNLTNNIESSLTGFIKNPIIIRNTKNIEIITEKIIHNLIVDDIENFMKELGDSFCFVGSEYKIKLGDTYNYIDLLLYNIEFNCYVVIELKVTELKKEHIGQIQVYMNYIDKNLRKINQDKTIGVIICKKDNKYVIEYSSDSRIITREYKLIC